MRPMNWAVSGTVNTWLRPMTMLVPMPMPNRATPTGRPMASTDPNARMRMTMAKAMPSVSEDGCSNSAKMNPPISMRRPSMSGASSRIWSRISPARVKSMSSGISTSA